MLHIDPYSYQKKIMLGFVFLSALIIFTLMLSIFLDWQWSVSSVIGSFTAPGILYFMQISELKKCFIEVRHQQITWKLLQDEKPKEIDLESDNPIFELNWMGLVIKDGTKTHAISLDGIKIYDRKRILKALKSYYQTESSLALC